MNPADGHLQIRFTRAGVDALAVLGWDKLWTCAAIPDLAEPLNMMFPIDDGPAYGAIGFGEAHEAAKWLKGTLEVPDRGPIREDDDDVY